MGIDLTLSGKDDLLVGLFLSFCDENPSSFRKGKIMGRSRIVSAAAAAGVFAAAYAPSPVSGQVLASLSLGSSVASSASTGSEVEAADAEAARLFRGPIARTPQDALRLLGERIDARDIDGIMALHERGAAIVVDYDGTAITGIANIRQFYLVWFDSNPVLTVYPQQTVIAGERPARVATVMGHYSLEMDGEDGQRVTYTGHFSDVIRQQWDGRWLYVVDNPYPPHDAP